MAERLNSVNNGGLRLPPGFRFHPTDEELVMQYLRRKVFSCPLPASIIPDVEVCKYDPWDLPGNTEEERYFFSMREAKYPTRNRANRATVSGYWKATGIDRQILTSGGNSVVGLKKTLIFYRGKSPSGDKTNWIMHEYSLACPDAPPPSHSVPLKLNLTQRPAAPVRNWVLCRIFLKKRSSKTDDDTAARCKDLISDNVQSSPIFYEFLTRDKSPPNLNLAPSSSSSGSSGITRVSPDRTPTNSAEDNDSSSCNSFSFTSTYK